MSALLKRRDKSDWTLITRNFAARPFHLLKLAGSVAALAMLATGCVMTVPLPPPSPPSTNKAQTGSVVVVSDFTDLRSDKEHIGIRKNGYGLKHGDFLPASDVNAWLASYLRNELVAAGFQVLSEDAQTTRTRVQGATLTFFIEPVLRTGMGYALQYISLFEADIGLQISVIRADGLRATKRYYAKAEQPSSVLILRDKELASSVITGAVQALMPRISDDLVQLLSSEAKWDGPERDARR